METIDLATVDTDAHNRRIFDNVALAVARAKRVVAVTGAGISVSSGIPDFRSENGLYNLVKERYPDVVLKGKDLFSAGLFREAGTASVFYAFAASLKREVDKAQPSRTHEFLVTLAHKRKLLRSYTQNIDGLELRAGLGDAPAVGKRKPQPHNVQLHGDIHRVRCTICSTDLPCTALHISAFEGGTPPPCPDCSQRSEARRARSARALKIGTLRPAIVLYDENHPQGDVLGALASADCARRPDLLLVMGTSLKVHGLKQLLRDFVKATRAGATTTKTSTTTATTSTQSASQKSKPPGLPRVVFINRTPPPTEFAGIFDAWVQGDTDDFVQRVEAVWRKARPQDWEVQTTLDENISVKVGPPISKPGKPFIIKRGAAPFKTTSKPKVTVSTNPVAQALATSSKPLQYVDEQGLLSDAEDTPPASQEPPPSSPASSIRSTLSSIPSTPHTPSTPNKRHHGSPHYVAPQGSPTPARPTRGTVLNDESSGDSESEQENLELACSPSKKRAVGMSVGTTDLFRDSPRKKLFENVTNSPGMRLPTTRKAPDEVDVFGSPMKMTPSRPAIPSTSVSGADVFGSPMQVSPVVLKRTAKPIAGDLVATSQGKVSKVVPSTLRLATVKPAPKQSGKISPKRTRAVTRSARGVERGQVDLAKIMNVPHPSRAR